MISSGSNSQRWVLIDSFHTCCLGTPVIVDIGVLYNAKTIDPYVYESHLLQNPDDVSKQYW